MTNALGPGASLPLVDVGFAVRGRLHLLVHDLTDLPPASRRTRRATCADRPDVLAVDAAAFDEFWRFDASALREATRARRRARARARRAPARRPGGVRPVRAGGIAGYVQRLAVAPHVQRAAWGARSLTDGLRWLRAHGAASRRT